MSHERISAFDDPNVKSALEEGRQPDDIALLNCPQCGRLGYYNQGSSFSCRHCDLCYGVYTEGEIDDVARALFHSQVIVLNDFTNQLTLQDALEAECSDYP